MSLKLVTLLAATTAVASLLGIVFIHAPDSKPLWFASPPSATNKSREPSKNGISCVGYVEPQTQVRALAFEATGIVASCDVEEGQQLSKSDVLMTLNQGELRQALAVAERELELARARKSQLLLGSLVHDITAAEHRLKSADLRLQHFRNEFDRSTRLFSTGATSASNHQTIETDFHVAEEEQLEAQARLLALKECIREEDRVLAQAEVALAESRVDQARQRLEQTILTAPCEGSVLEILKHPGESNKGSSDPVLIFADLSHLRIRAEVDELHVRELKVGQKAIVSGPNLGGESIIGRLSSQKHIMGPKTLFVGDSRERKDLEILEVWIELPEGSHLPVGLRVDVTILTESP